MQDTTGRNSHLQILEAQLPLIEAEPRVKEAGLLLAVLHRHKRPGQQKNLVWSLGGMEVRTVMVGKGATCLL